MLNFLFKKRGQESNAQAIAAQIAAVVRAIENAESEDPDVYATLNSGEISALLRKHAPHLVASKDKAFDTCFRATIVRAGVRTLAPLLQNLTHTTDTGDRVRLTADYLLELHRYRCYEAAIVEQVGLSLEQAVQKLNELLGRYLGQLAQRARQGEETAFWEALQISVNPLGRGAVLATMGVTLPALPKDWHKLVFRFVHNPVVRHYGSQPLTYQEVVKMAATAITTDDVALAQQVISLATHNPTLQSCIAQQHYTECINMVMAARQRA